ncbi:MAG: hypothetical protein KF861_12645 [Planctomycetaceae bacterium]|nr:hypothetical protein [Planctomycetaceae bacterium]
METVILEQDDRPVQVLDPFAGSGTTILAAESVEVAGVGIEAHPFLFRVAKAKVERTDDIDKYANLVKHVIQRATAIRTQTDHYPDLIQRCYPRDVLEDLDRLRRSVEECREESGEWNLIWLTLVGILRIVSPVGTAQWQYVLPKKQKKLPRSPFHAFSSLAQTITKDLHSLKPVSSNSQCRILQGDARVCENLPDNWATLVVTSPPYPNNYDYADATRLEMSFFGEVRGWGDLQEAVRKHLVRSCAQHVPESRVSLDEVLESEFLEPIRTEISHVCHELARIRLTKGGRKTYHLMVACYFHDLAQVWAALRRVCKSPSTACFVIGDSAPYGVYVPVMEWLGRLAVASGFRDYRFEKTRDRNVKWKNRKHRVPLCEGRLWVHG